jgi:hypothetical protein
VALLRSFQKQPISAAQIKHYLLWLCFLAFLSSPQNLAAGPSPTVPSLSYPAAVRFLEQASWGPTVSDIQSLRTIGFNTWFAQQRAAVESSFPMPTRIGPGIYTSPGDLLYNAINGKDQLRQRIAFALGQIWVTSSNVIPSDEGMVLYQQFLQNHAFSNYRDLMEAETLNPTMGYYLDVAGNWKADKSAGSSPNENYARELLQLFTIGTVQLNLDGTPKLDPKGMQIPTYDQSQITELARVFTGWYYEVPKGSSPGHPYFQGQMVPIENDHDTASKNVFGTILAAGQTAKQDLDQALDVIFNQPNVAPFVSTRLIQHFVTSNPSPAYVERISKVFVDNGNGVRGDLFAVVKALLLDPEARLGDDNVSYQAPTGGHLKEPVLYALGVLRALGASVPRNSEVWVPWSWRMEQPVYVPNSVFNYYSPLYNIPGSTLIGPEFQIFSLSAAFWRLNFLDALLDGHLPGVSIDLSSYTSLADQPGELVDAVDRTLTRGQMPSEIKTEIQLAVSKTPDALTRVRTAIYLTAASGVYQVER